MLIIFDLDDTLVDTTNSITPYQLESALLAMVDEGLKLQDYQKALQTLYAIDKKCTSSKQTLKTFLENQENQEKFYNLAIKRVYHHFPVASKIFSVPQAVDTLKSLSQKHLLSLVTVGMPEIQLYKLEKAGVDRSFFCKIEVAPIAEKKPYYESIIKNFSIDCKKVLVCGDKIEIDLIPAKQLGCITTHMRWGRGKNHPPCQKYVDYTITQLPELCDIIEGL